MELGKIPPNDVDAEQAVIGSMLTDKDAVIAAIEVLKEEDFYREDNKTIYSAILNLYNRSEPIDIITLKSELTAMGMFDKIGGFEYIVGLPEKVPTTANVEKYINIVKVIIYSFYFYLLNEKTLCIFNSKLSFRNFFRYIHATFNSHYSRYFRKRNIKGCT